METITRYRVVRLLGHGGMGQVFLAHDPTLERDVAIKLLHRDAAEQGLKAEAKALAALRHVGIVTIFEIGEHDGREFIAMEYLPGRSLRQVMQDGASREVLIGILAKVVEAVAAAHRAGILHRDLKPENVVVSDAGEVKVVDFGIATRLDQAMRNDSPPHTAEEVVEMLRRTLPPGQTTVVTAETGAMSGTPAYMAPEVMRCQPASSRSDVYSLGVMLYECLAGRRPYDASSLLELIAKMIDQTPPPLADPLAGLVARMLARDPKHRPALDEVSLALTKVTPPRKRMLSPLRVGAGMTVIVVAGLAIWMAARPPDAGTKVSTSMATAHTRLTANGRSSMVDWGALSPDGASLAYSDPDGLYVQEVRTGTRRSYPFPSSQARLVAWFPDGRSLLVTACSALDCSLWRVAIPSGASSLLRERASGGAISPDGQWLAYYAQDRVVEIAPVAGGNPIRLSPAVAYPREPPVWSPDSQRIAFVAHSTQPGGGYAIVGQGIREVGREVVTNVRLALPDGRFALVFLPDGRFVYGLANAPDEPAGTSLWMLEVDAFDGVSSPAPRRIGQFTGISVSHLSVAAQGTRIAALMTSTQADIYTGAMTAERMFTQAPTRLTEDDRDDRGASWLDRATVVFASDRGGRFEIFAQELAARSHRKLVDVDVVATWPTVRKEDVLFWATGPSGTSSLMATPRNGGAARQVRAPEVGLPFSPGGRPPPIGMGLSCTTASGRCVRSHRRGRDVQFFDLDGPLLASVQLVGIPGDNWEWALRGDGRALAFPNGHRLELLDLETGRVSVRVELAGALWHCVTWDVDGEGLFATGILPGAREFQIVHITRAGEVRPVWSSTGAWIGEPSVAPDGRHLAFTIKPLESDVWLIDLAPAAP